MSGLTEMMTCFREPRHFVVVVTRLWGLTMAIPMMEVLVALMC